MPNIHTTVTGEKYRFKKRNGPHPYPPGVKRVATNITLAPYWKRVAQEAAASHGESLSMYIERLVYADLMRIESAE